MKTLVDKLPGPIRRRLRAYSEGQRAVSPAIGSALLIAIAIIAAVVVGSFAFQYSQTGDTAPQAGIGVEQDRNIYMANGDGGGVWWVDLNKVVLVAEGGEPMDQAGLRVRASVKNESNTWSGFAVHRNNTSVQCTPCDGKLKVGWNSREEATIRSGDSTVVSMYTNPSAWDEETQINESEWVTLLDGQGLCEFDEDPLPQTASNENTYGTAGKAKVHQRNPREWELDMLFSTTLSQNCPLESSANNYYTIARHNDLKMMGYLTDEDAVEVVWSPEGSRQSSLLRTYVVK